MHIKFRTRLKHKALIDITSLIDLVFLLVAFFMVTSTLGSESSITVHLPKAVQSKNYPERGNLIVSMNEANEVFLNDEKYGTESLLDEFKKRKETIGDKMVIIRGDRKTDYETVVKIIDLLNRAGIPRFTIATVKGSE